MNATKKTSGGSIHRIREFELEKVSLAEEFDILQIVGEGWFGKILLVEHRTTDAEMVLKALPKPYVSLRDFYREFHYGLHLGAHKNIVTTFDVAFETAGFYVFTQEYAPLGDLTSNVSDSGIGELHTKRVAKQIAAALDFMHSKDLVHRDVKLDNVLIFRSDFSRVKLCDFGESRRNGTPVQRRNEWLPYSPPEVLSVPTDDTYKTDFSHDVWQFGIVVFVCLTGCLPWQKAAADDPRYMRYILWHSATLSFPLRRTPKLFKLASSRACKLFRKILEPRPDKRPKNLTDISKFMDDRWLSKGAEKDMIAMEPDELCPSMYSFHSNPEEKNRLLSTLIEYGVEPTVDRVAKKARIREWIQSSVITEENEEEEEETNSSGRNSPNIIFNRTPVAGHISSIRAEEAAQKKIVSTIKDATNKHYDPRTGLEQEGPSLMVSPTLENLPNAAYTNGNSSRHQTPDKELITQSENNLNSFGNFNYNNQNQSTGQPNYSISQQYSSSLVSESGEQTQVDARLNVPIHSSSEHNLRPPLREHRSKKSTATQIFGKSKSFKEPRTSSHGLTTYSPSESNPIIKDNGYGSMDRIKTNENINPRSPVLVKRSSIKSSSDSGSLNAQHNSNPPSKDHSPFDSDGHDADSLRGSSGFVNFSGMKDSPYDRVKTKRK